ncbi:MAG: pyruvate, orthophosphate dikinase [Thermomicrobiales bacterium]|nr:pyruvate, orthophosphate dikinase [Thermomicrobiales bacterium]MEA2596392.1 pyruvate, orthophosphate dikinase [Thermomicrobiales bacterium]
MTTQCWVSPFGAGDASQRRLLGGKGANLAEMTRLGLPIPPGFTVTTDACRAFLADGAIPDGLWEEVAGGLQDIERQLGRRFGDAADPLLVSVRSGAAASMPGMMETVLNLGLADATVAGLAARAGDDRFAWDSFRRLVQMYGRVVLGIPGDHFETRLAAHKRRAGVEVDAALDAPTLRSVVDAYRDLVRQSTGRDFPDDPWEQLRGAVEAVFRSWNTARAIAYRREFRIPEDLGTAVTVQAMVFGNLGDDCATGVAFTRDPATGERKLVGEYLPNAQGEDVVAGIRTPLPLDGMAADPRLAGAFADLQRVAATLEGHFADAQDLEFTIERGRLWMLQTRAAKRTGLAAVRIAVAMVGEGLIEPATAVRRVQPDQLSQLLHPTIDPAADPEVLTVGLPASPGAASGLAVFDSTEAQQLQAEGRPVILVRRETSPEDFPGMVAARGIVTAHGGTTSHAAVVARGMGKPCVTGAGALEINEVGGVLTVGETVVRRHDWLTIDGGTGRVMRGRVATIRPETGEEYRQLLAWADAARGLRVRANADTPQDAALAVRLGAEGIGLCRTEHMFFQGTRIQAVREMILADDDAARAAALAKLLPLQREDFVGIFRAMDGLPVTIRTLDPPLHEFLPHAAAEEANLAWELGLDVGVVRTKVQQLREANPMLGFRGCRLGVAYPEITAMQARAIFSAACRVAREGCAVLPEVMIPLVCAPRELELQRAVVDRTAETVFAEEGIAVPYLVGTMIELPRAALIADQIARFADFLSFGTNDLTQTALGMSRDDAGRFLPGYVRQGILPRDPFTSLDVEGVGRLVEIGTRLGRSTRPDLKVGVCGEHGGDPDSIAFFARAGLDYVSCSPYRVPIARLAAAHASDGSDGYEASAE